jgi:nitroreductase
MKQIIKAVVVVVGLMSCTAVALAQQAGVKLPQPTTQGGMPLMDALKNRETSRSFKSDELPLQILSNLLWAADGINRPNGKYTAPSSMNYQEIDIFVALKDGIYKYNTKSNSLEFIMQGDYRAQTGKQAFVGEAPVNLIYIADFSRVPKGETPEQLNASYANCGFIAQNVYLFCASENLGCVVRGYFDSKELSKVMKLQPTQKIILTQTVGYKK